jgi:AraC-like DNA-binding protein
MLRRHLDREMPSLEEVGKALGMTPQTLRRRLQEEGQGYQAIKDDLRRDAAIEYLARPDLTLIGIANLLGFSEASTFHRAFKKWTGVAPGEYRHSRMGAAGQGGDATQPPAAGPAPLQAGSMQAAGASADGAAGK